MYSKSLQNINQTITKFISGRTKTGSIPFQEKYELGTRLSRTETDAPSFREQYDLHIIFSYTDTDAPSFCGEYNIRIRSLRTKRKLCPFAESTIFA